jgi:hypothetical protein
MSCSAGRLGFSAPGLVAGETADRIEEMRYGTSAYGRRGSTEKVPPPCGLSYGGMIWI